MTNDARELFGRSPAAIARDAAQALVAGRDAASLHYEYMPDKGACGKTRVMPHSRRP